MFGSFFHASNFKEFLSEDQAKAAAKKADEIINAHATVLFGCDFADGSAENFSTTRLPTDTHVALAVGIEPMAAFAPKDTYSRKTELSHNDMIKAQQIYIKQLEQIRDKRGNL